jgi:hypothetical protein
MDGSRAPTTDPLRLQMAAEGRRIVDAARARGVTLRLLGGLAVATQCYGLASCARDYADVDLAGFSREAAGVVDVLRDLGYGERAHVRTATIGRQAQFERPCEHVTAGGGRAHADDHVDVFFDRFRMEHELDLRERLGLHPYTLSASDLLVTKLLITHAEPRDMHDALHLLAVAPDAPGAGPEAIDAAYIAGLCAGDWGLFYDVTRNLRRCAEAAGASGLGPGHLARVTARVAELTGAIDAVPKTLGWRLRARVGTRRPWHQLVEEEDGGPPAGSGAA